MCKQAPASFHVAVSLAACQFFVSLWWLIHTFCQTIPIATIPEVCSFPLQAVGWVTLWFSREKKFHLSTAFFTDANGENHLKRLPFLWVKENARCLLRFSMFVLIRIYDIGLPFKKLCKLWGVLKCPSSSTIPSSVYVAETVRGGLRKKQNKTKQELKGFCVGRVHVCMCMCDRIERERRGEGNNSENIF